MTVYILHIEPPYRHARHYVGYTPDSDPTRRVKEHLRGASAGSPLIKAAVACGHEVTLACAIEGDRTRERQIKNQKNTPRVCPMCRAQRRHR